MPFHVVSRLMIPMRFLALLLSLACLPLSAVTKPDVLFIAVDDLNDWTGYLQGHPQAKTPNIDRLVARGTAFTNAHCAAPACNPSRAALMSGLRPWTTGIYTNGDPAKGVLKDITTLNRHFLAHGYNTRGGGKIYHNFSSEGREDGWTEWAGLFPSISEHEENFTGMNRGHFDWGPVEAKPEDMGDYKLTDWAIHHLQTAPTDQPLFLGVGYVKPHLPWYVPKEYFARFPLETIQLPVTQEGDLADIPLMGQKLAGADHAAVLKAAQWKKGVQAYLATISFLDDQVGRLLDGLDASPRKDKTIIVWWTDHGWALGEKEHWRKFALWEETTRTSFAIVAPGVTQAGTLCSAPVDYTHVYPTLCELTGLPKPHHVQGPSLMPLFKDPNAPWEHIAVCSHGRGNHAARDAQWRYIRYADGSEELYDHRQDPHEWTNLAANPGMNEIKARLRSVFPQQEATPTSGGQGSNGSDDGGPQKGKGKSGKKTKNAP